MVDIMATGATYPFGVMLGLLPVDVLLVMALGKFVGIEMSLIPGGKGCGFKVRRKRFPGFVADSPFSFFVLGGFPSVVARPANLHSRSGRELCWIDDRLAFFKHRCLRQGGVPRAFSMASLASDARLTEIILVEID